MQSEILLLVLPGLIWGASFLFIAEGLRAVDPNGVTFLRIAAGFLTLALFPAAHKPVERRDWSKIAGLGILWFAFPLSMFPLAEQRVSSALTGMLNGANPLFATLVASLLAHKAPSRGVLGGLAAGLLGTVVMAIPALGEGHSEALGVALIVVALISYGFALSLARSLQLKYGAIPCIWRAQAVGIVLTAPLGVRDLFHMRWAIEPLLCILALGIGGTAIANVLLATSAGRVGAAKASGTTFLIPPVALLLGVAVRGEHVALLSIAGSAICVLGVWFMKRASAH